MRHTNFFQFSIIDESRPLPNGSALDQAVQEIIKNPYYNNLQFTNNKMVMRAALFFHNYERL